MLYMNVLRSLKWKYAWLLRKDFKVQLNNFEIYFLQMQWHIGFFSSQLSATTTIFIEKNCKFVLYSLESLIFAPVNSSRL